MCEMCCGRWCSFKFWLVYRVVMALLSHFNWYIACFRLNCVYFAAWKSYDKLWFWSHLLLCICFPPLRKENYLLVFCTLMRAQREHPNRSLRENYELLYSKHKYTKSERELNRLDAAEGGRSAAVDARGRLRKKKDGKSRQTVNSPLEPLNENGPDQNGGQIAIPIAHGEHSTGRGGGELPNTAIVGRHSGEKGSSTESESEDSSNDERSNRPDGSSPSSPATDKSPSSMYPMLPATAEAHDEHGKPREDGSSDEEEEEEEKDDHTHTSSGDLRREVVASGLELAKVGRPMESEKLLPGAIEPKSGLKAKLAARLPTFLRPSSGSGHSGNVLDEGGSEAGGASSKAEKAALATAKREERRREREKRKAEKKAKREAHARRREELKRLAKIERKRRNIAAALSLLLTWLRMGTSFAIMVGNLHSALLPKFLRSPQPLSSSSSGVYGPNYDYGYTNDSPNAPPDVDTPDVLMLFMVTMMLDILLFWMSLLWTYMRQCRLCFRLGLCWFWLWLVALGFVGGVCMFLPMHYVHEQLDVSWCAFRPRTPLSRWWR